MFFFFHFEKGFHVKFVSYYVALILTFCCNYLVTLAGGIEIRYKYSTTRNLQTTQSLYSTVMFVMHSAPKPLYLCPFPRRLHQVPMSYMWDALSNKFCNSIDNANRDTQFKACFEKDIIIQVSVPQALDILDLTIQN